MNEEINFSNNPLHGVGLKQVLTELVDHYGFEILYAYLNINCFNINASIDSSIKFLKKTDWAREKVEAFYLYQYKNLPRASDEQFELPPRDRIIPDGQVPGKPAELSLEDAARLQEKRAKKAAERRGGRFSKDAPSKNRFSREKSSDNWRLEKKPSPNQSARSESTDSSTSNDKPDPWAKWRK